MKQTKEMLNQVLVNIFNQIMFNEEKVLQSKLNNDITIRNIHILDAINSELKEGSASMGNIANKLSITAGTLTTALKKLEALGYITRKQGETDKRKFYISLTEKGNNVVKIHRDYHNKMIEMVTSNLSVKEEADLVDLLSKIKYYFTI